MKLNTNAMPYEILWCCEEMNALKDSPDFDIYWIPYARRPRIVVSYVETLDGDDNVIEFDYCPFCGTPIDETETGKGKENSHAYS